MLSMSALLAAVLIIPALIGSASSATGLGSSSSPPPAPEISGVVTDSGSEPSLTGLVILESHDCSKGAAFSWGTESHDFGSFCLQNGSHKAIKQPDCNFVIYNGSEAIWASQTSDSSFWFTNNYAHIAMQRDGNIVLYWNRGGSSPNGLYPQWWTSTPHRALTTMVMQADGNLVVYGNGSEVLWSSGTAGR